MCALPTAQLGSLGNMSMPYSIPTYEKGPGVLEKAVAAFLVNAAGGVAQQGAQNVMSRDYAPEFGEESAKGFGRLLGPKVGERAAGQRRDQTFTREESERQRGATRSLENVRQAGDDRRLGVREKGDNFRAGMSQTGENTRLQSQLGAQGENQAANREVEMMRAILGPLLQQQDPTNVAQGRYYNASADSLDAKAGFMNRIGNGQGQPQATGASPAREVNPNIAKFAQGGGAIPAPAESAPVPTALPQEDYYASLQELLRQGLTPEDAAAVLQRQSAVRTRVDGPAKPNVTAFGDSSAIANFLESIINPATINDPR